MSTRETCICDTPTRCAMPAEAERQHQRPGDRPEQHERDDELDKRMDELREAFGLDAEDLNLDLGPLGKLL